MWPPVVALFAVLLPAPAAAVPFPVPVRPELLRIDARFVPATSRRSFSTLQVEILGVRRGLAVDQITVTSGDRLGSEVLSEVAPFTPALYLRGPREVLAPLRDAADGEPVRVIGLRRVGSRTVLVGSVRVGPP